MESSIGFWHMLLPEGPSSALMEIRMVNPPSWSDLFPAISEFLGAAKGRHEQTALLLRVQVVLLFLSLVVLVFIAYRVT